MRYFQKTLMSLSTAKESVRIDRISYKVQVKTKEDNPKSLRSFFLCQTLEAKVQFCSPILLLYFILTKRRKLRSNK